MMNIIAGLILPDEKGEASVRIILARFGKTFWRVFIKLSENGYMRVNSLHQRDIKFIKRELARHGLTVDALKELNGRLK